MLEIHIHTYLHIKLLFLNFSYPLINIPLPGTIPTKIVLPFDGKNSLFGEGERSNLSLVKNIFSINNVSYEPHVPWAQNSPILYVQQITLRSSVLPWTEDMQLMDAFRAPLYEVFRLLEIVRNHETTKTYVKFLYIHT